MTDDYDYQLSRWLSPKSELDEMVKQLGDEPYIIEESINAYNEIVYAVFTKGR